MSDLERLGESLRAAMRQRDDAYREVHALKKENAYLKKTIIDLRRGDRELTSEIARLHRIPPPRPPKTVNPKPKGEPRK